MNAMYIMYHRANATRNKRTTTTTTNNKKERYTNRGNDGNIVFHFYAAAACLPVCFCFDIKFCGSMLLSSHRFDGFFFISLILRMCMCITATRMFYSVLCCFCAHLLLLFLLIIRSHIFFLHLYFNIFVSMQFKYHICTYIKCFRLKLK